MKTMTKQFLLIFAVFIIFGSASATVAQKRGASTPKERESVVQMVNFLETQPFAKEAKDYRASLLYFLAEVPDISVTLVTIL